MSYSAGDPVRIWPRDTAWFAPLRGTVGRVAKVIGPEEIEERGLQYYLEQTDGAGARVLDDAENVLYVVHLPEEDGDLNRRRLVLSVAEVSAVSAVDRLADVVGEHRG